MAASPEQEPFVHHPNIKQDDSVLFCFLDKERPCTAECMAYLGAGELPPGEDYQDKQWPRCHLLVNAHRAGKHLVVLASVLNGMSTKMRNEAADRARTQQTPPPAPR
jgi:hypothetical protein